jgi:hypothetical protein
MNMSLRKLKPALIDGSDVLGVLDERLRELQARRGIVTKQIITLEKTAAATRIDASVDVAQAEALLEGSQFVASRDKPLSLLDALLAERGVIDRALMIGLSRQHRLATERAGEIWASHFAEIAEIEKRRVFLAIKLQHANRAREKLREKLTKVGGAGYLTTDSVALLGLGDHGDDETAWAAERLIADNIVTRAEVERARANG